MVHGTKIKIYLIIEILERFYIHWKQQKSSDGRYIIMTIVDMEQLVAYEN